MFDAEVSAVHVVQQDGVERARELAAAHGVRLLELEGPPAETLAQTVDDDEDAVALVVGTRAPHGGREIGSTALEVVTSAHKPVFTIPPELAAEFAIRRVLVPLEGSRSTSYAP
jgi:nucleotide-binding universal stress UspA family protein